MCGISGIINKNNTKVNSTDLKAINALIAHRGPDSDGFFYGENFALGHRRLSIIGLGKEGHQPMKKYNLTLSFNGEIYNYIEVRDELKTLGHNFSTSTDTEVILSAYQQWGQDCVNKFNGMWAFVIHDEDKNQLFASRDRFGIKPFYYLNNDKQFIFGSEIKQLLYFIEQPIYNKSILLDYLITGLEDHTPETFFKDVLKLASGHNLIYDLSNHEVIISPYYQLKADQGEKDEAKAVEAYKFQLTSAIKLRMRSDVKVGTCLSGGLDSSAVAAISSKIYKENSSNKFNAIHAKSSEVGTDESVFAKEVAKHCDLELNLIEPNTQDFLTNIDEVIYTQEEPFGSPSIFMQYFVMKKAKEIDCKVMLDGQGGDETLLGYEKYYPAYLKSLSFLPFIKAFFNSSKNSKLSMLDVVKYFFYFTKYKLRLKRLKQKNSFLKDEIKKNFTSPVLKDLSEKYLNINALQQMEIRSTQLPHLLRYEDKNSMRNSIETRLPFIDYKTLETALSTNHSFKIKDGWTKYILRKSINDLLPKSVVWRKNKFGFNAPETVWMKAIEPQFMYTIKSSSILDELVNLDEIKLHQLDMRTKWKLFNIAKWENLYHVKTS